MEFNRESVEELIGLLQDSGSFLQVIVGPRQVGKSTAAKQVIKKLKWPYVFATADSPVDLGEAWIESQWQLAKMKMKDSDGPVLLVLDEIQKVRGWSEVVKRLWDLDDQKHRLRVILLGSSALLIQKGLTESLAGRFMLHRFTHWTYSECQDAFGVDLDEWIYFGGYPGAIPLIKDQSLWKRYIADSLIETAIARDVLNLEPIKKPILLRHLFSLAAAYRSEILSYNKMLGQLQDAGNTTTLAHYLKLLEGAFLVSGLELFSQGQVRQKASSPKLILWNNALVNALSDRSFEDARVDLKHWGRLVENAVGAHLVNQLTSPEWRIQYWKMGDYEVDFVVSKGKHVWALEVKSGRAGKISGLKHFQNKYPHAKTLLIGSHGIPLEEFFKVSVSDILG